MNLSKELNFSVLIYCEGGGPLILRYSNYFIRTVLKNRSNYHYRFGTVSLSGLERETVLGKQYQKSETVITKPSSKNLARQ